MPYKALKSMIVSEPLGRLKKDPKAEPDFIKDPADYVPSGTFRGRWLAGAIVTDADISSWPPSFRKDMLDVRKLFVKTMEKKPNENTESSADIDISMGSETEVIEAVTTSSDEVAKNVAPKDVADMDTEGF